MNEELLNTYIVKSSILRYLKQGLNLDEIIEKLLDIHLIIITKKELISFLFQNETYFLSFLKDNKDLNS